MTFKVCKTRCDQCLLSPNKIVSNSRRAEILRKCRAEDRHFICHKATISGQDVCCRGFYETQSTNLIRIAQRLGVVEEVDVEALCREKRP